VYLREKKVCMFKRVECMRVEKKERAKAK
jgi:hypothetical protein